MLPRPLAAAYAGKKCLITGGMGFIGSNLAIALAQAGAVVTVLDNMLEGHGGNLFNIDPVRQQLHVNFGDILSASALAHLVRGQDIVFHLAGQVSHVLSLSNPFPDIDINIKGTAVLMEAVKHFAPQSKVVYTGTRGQYGSSVSLPVSETAPTNPKGIYEVCNLTAEKIIQVYAQNFGISAVLLRLTNTYGPRAQMMHSHFGVVNWFVRQVIDGMPIPIFGDGNILRDFVYVEDAVRACALAGCINPEGDNVFNIGSDIPVSFLSLAKTLIVAAGTGSYAFRDFSPERRAQEPGDFYSDITRARKALGWEPEIPLAEGLKRTVAYYRQHQAHYWQG